MGTKMHMKKRAALVGAAVLPAVAGMAGLMAPSVSDAAITFTVTNQGTAFDNFGQTATGYTGLLLTLVADPGNVISAIDIGQTSTSTNGIFGPLLQDWVPTKTGFNPTPVSSSQNGGPLGIDTHVVVASGRVDVTAPFEDSNNINPGGGVPPNIAGGSGQSFGTGTFLRGVFGIVGASQLASQPVAYVVLKNGTSATFNIAASESIGGSFQLTGTITAPGGVALNKIVQLTAASGGAPTTFGNKLTQGAGVDKATFNPNNGDSKITVTGSNGSYIPGFANNINSGAGQNKFYVEAAGFNPASDPEVYAYNILVGGVAPTAGQITTIINDINANSTGVVASNVTGAFAALFPGYDILLTSTTNSADQFLAADFTAETNVAGVTVTDVAAVPEPASAAGVILGAAGLLLGRRKRQLASA